MDTDAVIAWSHHCVILPRRLRCAHPDRRTGGYFPYIGRSLYADILTWYDWDFIAAEREYLKTLEIDPLNVLGYALFLSTQERHDEAIAAIEQRLAAAPDESLRSY